LRLFQEFIRKEIIRITKRRNWNHWLIILGRIWLRRFTGFPQVFSGGFLFPVGGIVGPIPGRGENGL